MRFRAEGLLLGALLVACQTPTVDSADSAAVSTDSGDTGLNDPYIDGRHCPDDLAATWESFGQGFLLDHCVGCHSANVEGEARSGAPVGVDFETHAKALQWLQSIFVVSADAAVAMPPADSVPAEDRFILGDWLACGAP